MNMLDEARKYGIMWGYSDMDNIWRNAVESRKSLGTKVYSTDAVRQRLEQAYNPSDINPLWLPPEPEGWHIPSIDYPMWFDTSFKSKLSTAVIMEPHNDSWSLHLVHESYAKDLPFADRETRIEDGDTDHINKIILSGNAPTWVYSPRLVGTIIIHFNGHYEINNVEYDDLMGNQIRSLDEGALDTEVNDYNLRCFFFQPIWTAILTAALMTEGIATYSGINRSEKNRRKFIKTHGVAPTDRMIIHLHQPVKQKEKDRHVKLHFTRGHWKTSEFYEDYKPRYCPPFWSGNPDLGIVWNTKDIHEYE